MSGGIVVQSSSLSGFKIYFSEDRSVSLGTSESLIRV
jgi:hypothetical protein